jgi:predicted nucleotidyltransferase
MINNILVSTVNQKILQFLARFSDQQFHEREISRRVGVASGSANRALNQLHAANVVKRKQEGKMLFYFINTSIPAITEFKKLVNILLIEPLAEDLKSYTKRIVLYGSCAQGVDSSKSDIDIFIVTDKRKRVIETISNFSLAKGFEGIQIQPVIKTPIEILSAGASEKIFLNEVEKGITLWESSKDESGV